MEEKVVTLDIIKIFVKDMSIEMPNPVSLYLQGSTIENWALEMQNTVTPINEDIFEISLTAMVKGLTKSGEEDKVNFLVEATQTGFFRIQNATAEQLDFIVNAECLHILFPYLRENVANAVMKAGLMSFDIAPVNFMALYQQKVMQQNQGNTLQ